MASFVWSTVIAVLCIGCFVESKECEDRYGKLRDGWCPEYKTLRLSSHRLTNGALECGQHCTANAECVGFVLTKHLRSCYLMKAGCSSGGKEDVFEFWGKLPCPVDGGYSRWSAFGACTTTCEDGTQSRTRTCTNPPPSNGGKQCQGSGKETRKCPNAKNCAVDGVLSNWSGYGGCSKKCGRGTQTRTRKCTPPSHGGKPCPGALSSTRNCNTHACAAYSTCRTGNWGSSFDRQGWSLCNGARDLVQGLYRNRNHGNNDGLFVLEAARCCTVDSGYGNEPLICNQANWWSTLDHNYRWATCGNGYFLKGFYRTNGFGLNHLEYGKCCKPQSAPSTWEHCYDHDVSRSFDNQQWSNCNNGYYLAGIWRGSCDRLYCVEKFRCCKMRSK